MKKPPRVLTMKETKALEVLRVAMSLAPSALESVNAYRARVFAGRMLRALRWTPGGRRRKPAA